MVNKKAQDLSIGTLILIVLGIIVLVLLILGFSIGWGNLWEKINIFGGGSSIGDVVTACNLAVTSNNKYDYCDNFRKVKIDGKTEYVNCEDGRVNDNEGISCLGDEETKQCLKLINDATEGKSGDDKVKACNEVSIEVNDKLCTSIMEPNYCNNLITSGSCKSLCSEKVGALLSTCTPPSGCQIVEGICKEIGATCSSIRDLNQCNARSGVCSWVN